MRQSTLWCQSGCSRSTPTTQKQFDIVICIVLILGVQNASHSTGGYWWCVYLIKKNIWHDDYVLNLKGIKRPICKKAFHPNSPFVIIALVAGGTLNCKKRSIKKDQIHVSYFESQNYNFTFQKLQQHHKSLVEQSVVCHNSAPLFLKLQCE